MGETALLALLRASLTEGDLELLRSPGSPPSDAGYDGAMRAVLQKLPALERQVARGMTRVETRYQDVTELPRGRLLTLLTNSDPPLLAALCRVLMRRSFQARFADVEASLRCAEIAQQAARSLRDRDYFAPDLQADLEAEAWSYLANARRINSDLPGAETAFRKAESHLELGTGDRTLRATFCFLKAFLSFRQGRCSEATALLDQEIGLRRLLGDRDRLAHALINRGVVTAWSGPLDEACDYLLAGVRRTDDDDYLALALPPLAERLARDGRPQMAWKTLRAAETVTRLTGARGHDLRLRWIRGLAHRASGELESAAGELCEVREELVRRGQRFKAALAALDLAAVRVAQGRHGEVKSLAREAYEIFRSEAAEKRMLTAFLVLYRAVEAGELTEAVAVRVANFVARAQHDRSLRFSEAPGS
ncbi:MAG: hypothetical protein R3325_15765 [Thermoanaerobaculia bacterium]|nr:hypothetical protein [Thermoanaerobaculia bacterium]